MDRIFFQGWDGLVSVLVTTVLSYIVLIIFLRASGKRTLSKMNAFDFIVTIALGSTLAALILNRNIPLAEGLLGLFLLVYLQYIITWISARSSRFSSLIKSTPTLLVYKGRMLHHAMRKERIDEDEIYSIIRKNGCSTLEEADAIVLESDGSLNFIRTVKDWQAAPLKKLKKPGTASN